VVALERARTNLKRYRNSLFHAAISGRLSANCGLGLGPEGLPKSWRWVALAELGTVARGKSKHRPRNDPRLMGGPYPFIQTGEVGRSTGYIRDYSATYSDFGLAQSKLWPEGTLCITIAANIAETGILTFPACFPDSVVGFVRNGDTQTIRFLDIFFRASREELERYAPATAQKNINLATLERLRVPLPPADELVRIVAQVESRLSIIDDAESTINNNLKRAELMRQSILRKAFTGQLVPQDPEDEPAVALLERIREERAATTIKRPQSRRSNERQHAL
jgi:type I restriction enzyme S subunit